MEGKTNYHTEQTTDKQTDAENTELIGRKSEDKEILEGKIDEDETTLNFDNLPDVPMRIILKMLRHNDTAEILKLRLVSKAVKKIVDNNGLLAWKVTPKNFCISDLQHMLEVSDRDINLDFGIKFDVEENLWKKMAAVTERYSHRIYSVTGTLEMIEYLMKMQEMPRLERVTCSGKGKSILTEALLLQLNNVKYLHLCHLKLVTFMGSLPHLETLILEGVESADKDAYPRLLSSCSPSLQKLEIHTYRVIPDDMIYMDYDFGPIRNHQIEMKQLKHLVVDCDLASCTIIDLTALLSICSKSLEYVDMTGCYIQQDSPTVSCEFPKLKFLKFYMVNLKPLLPLLCSPHSLEKVEMLDVDFDYIKGVPYTVSPIKKLELQHSLLSTFGDWDTSASDFEFLGKCAAKSDSIEITRDCYVPDKTPKIQKETMKVDYQHLLPEKFDIFKRKYYGVCE